MSMMTTRFGDFGISGSCATLDATTAIPLYEFTPEKDGAYTVIVNLLEWQPGGDSVQWYVQACWTRIGGVLSVDGAPFQGGIGNLGGSTVTLDVSGAKCRLLVTGSSSTPVLLRLKGNRFDVTA